jgi:hypothetical protein
MLRVAFMGSSKHERARINDVDSKFLLIIPDYDD